MPSGLYSSQPPSLSAPPPSPSSLFTCLCACARACAWGCCFKIHVCAKIAPPSPLLSTWLSVCVPHNAAATSGLCRSRHTRNIHLPVHQKTQTHKDTHTCRCWCWCCCHHAIISRLKVQKKKRKLQQKKKTLLRHRQNENLNCPKGKASCSFFRRFNSSSLNIPVDACDVASNEELFPLCGICFGVHHFYFERLILCSLLLGCMRFEGSKEMLLNVKWVSKQLYVKKTKTQKTKSWLHVQDQKCFYLYFLFWLTWSFSSTNMPKKDKWFM